ncbi:cupin domain-containing protein [Tardibacter chloracetimidivorans]|nr:cupin domain-containing protein [Tardibacter chloracetimidivorans]
MASVEPLAPVRMVVTANSGDSGAVVLHDADRQNSLLAEEFHDQRVPGAALYNLWKASVPAETGDTTLIFDFPNVHVDPGAVVWQVLDMPPGLKLPAHKTDTLDFVIVVSGEIALGVGDREIVVRAGDHIAQLDPIHYWHNQGDEVCRLSVVRVSNLPLPAA